MRRGARARAGVPLSRQKEIDTARPGARSRSRSASTGRAKFAQDVSPGAAPAPASSGRCSRSSAPRSCRSPCPAGPPAQTETVAFDCVRRDRVEVRGFKPVARSLRERPASYRFVTSRGERGEGGGEGKVRRVGNGAAHQILAVLRLLLEPLGEHLPVLRGEKRRARG